MAGAAKSSDPAIGLALGGGGARGLAHIAVIEALGEMGVRPSVIAGTSIGAIVGAAYASGIAPRDALEHARRILGSRGQAIRQLISHPQARLRDVFGLGRWRGAILDGEAILAIALPEVVSHTFDSLSVPTRVVATDFNARRPQVFAAGPLGPPLAASMSLPALFSAVEIDGRYYVDGGMTNPLPYDVIQDDCDIVLAVDVTGGRTIEPGTSPTTGDVLFGSIQIMLNALVEARLSVRPPDILIRPPVDGFRVLDLFKLDQIIAAAAPAKDEIKRKLDAAISSFARRRTGA